MIDLEIIDYGGEVLPLEIDTGPDIALSFEGVYYGGRLPDYTGPVTVTPSGTAQTLDTAGTSVLDNIVIEPIPNWYGLVQWNGSYLSVS